MPRESQTSLYPDFDPVDVVALTMLDGFGAATARAHLAMIRSTSRPIDDTLDVRLFSEARRRSAASIAAAAGAGIALVVDGHADYPDSLRDLEHPPVTVWMIGDPSLASTEPVISIVGTRAATPYGDRVARMIGTAFSRAGATIVSGMALGIDATAHRAALDVNGRTVAVLGTGVDVPYPAPHRGLHRQIAARGLLMSESPPGTRAGPGCFPRRNRIIAALGQATIVIEAGVKSGALNTADHAMQLGRSVGVVPGAIDSPASLGSNNLMRDGAHPLPSVADALALIGLSDARPAPVHLESDDERAVYAALERAAPDLDELCSRTRLPARRCFGAVTALELRGMIECGITGEVRRR